MVGADVIVVGGGLAGSAFALELARGGAQVTLLERSRGPTLKVCGDFLSGEALDVLTYLGLDVRGIGAKSINTLTLSAGSKAAQMTLPFAAAGFSRLSLDEILLEQAEAAGVDVRRGVSVTGLRCDDRTVLVSSDDSTYTATAAALATGKHNLRGWQRPAGSATAFKLKFALTSAARNDLADHVQLAFLEGGHVGACLVEDDMATICWQLDTGRLKDLGKDWRDQLAAFARSSRVFESLLDGARPIQPQPVAISNLPFGYVRRETIGNRVFPLGDQMAVIPSITGDGTAIALSSGVTAAKALLRGKTAPRYQRDFAGKLRRQFAVALGLNYLMRSSMGRTIGVHALGSFPSIAACIANATRLSANSSTGAMIGNP